MPGVFLSYSRADEEFATRLRNRLEQEAPDVSLWQDRARMEGGIGWWQQIRDALERVEFMVLVMSQATLHSETVQKEWRYARQQGVCVYPVKAAEFDFSLLPRWMSSTHFFDVEREWPTIVQHLRSPAYPRRVPFMAPDLPANFVARPTEFTALRSFFLEPARLNAVAATTTVYGAGGFGKTTLAAALCHDEDLITAFFDGILWITLGRSPNLQVAVTAVYNALTGGQTAFADLPSAGIALAEQIQDRTCLIAIDDVWDASHLQPFLRGGRNCARLITTRDFRIAADFAHVKVDEMRGAEAWSLLAHGLSPEPLAGLGSVSAEKLRIFEEPARRLGEWPLLLELANATLRHRVARGDTVQGALAHLGLALDRRGITRFDPLNHTKIAHTIEISLESLQGQRQHYLEFSIFPENADIPLSAVQELCAIDDFDAEELVQSMHDLSLLHFELQSGVFRLHDAIRAWLKEQLPDPRSVHARLLAAWPALHALPNRYAWQWIGYHLAAAGQLAQLRSLLLDFDWLQAKLEATDANGLAHDFEFLSDDAEARLVHSAICVSAHVLSKDKKQLAGQLLGRLQPGGGASVAALLHQAARWHGGNWLRPLNTSLTAAGGPLLGTLIVKSTGSAPIALDQNGHTAVCVDEDGAIREWNLQSAIVLRSISPQKGTIRALALVRPGRVLAGIDDKIQLWDLDSGVELMSLPGHTGAVTCVAPLTDGRRAISASADGTIRLWDLESGSQVLSIPAHRDKVIGVCLLPGGRALTGSRDGTLRLWDLESGAKLKSFLARGRITAIAVTPEGGRVIAGLSSGSLKLWEVESGAEVGLLEGHTDRISAVAVTPDGCRAISASSDSTVRVWDLTERCEVCCLTGHTEGVISAMVSGDGKRAASLSYDGTMKLWDLERSTRGAILDRHGDGITAIAVIPTRRQVLSGSRDGTVRLWDVDSQTEVLCLRAGFRELKAIAVAPDGSSAICASQDRVLRLFHLDSGKLLREYHGHMGEVVSVAITPDGCRVASAADDRTVRVWDIASGLEIRSFTPHTRSTTAIAVNEGRILSGAWDSGSWDGALKLWDLDSGEEIRRYQGLSDSVSSIAVTSDFGRAVSGCWDGTVKGWNLESSVETLSYAGHADWITSVALTPDGKYVVSASHDHTLHMWELATGQVAARFTGDGPLTACAVLPDGVTVIAGEASGAMHFLKLELGRP